MRTNNALPAVRVISDVGEADFRERVIERSRTVPVVVDFWAGWCGPCRQLGPVLERIVGERDGRVELAKVDIEANAALAERFRVSSIPAVVAIRDAEVADAFVGVLPPDRIERFIDRIDPEAPPRGLRRLLRRG